MSFLGSCKIAGKYVGIFCLCILSMMFCFTGARAAAQGLGETERQWLFLYIPQDDRPVCFSDTVETLQAAGIRVETPPAEWLASRNRTGNTEAIWQWVMERAWEADGLIASADTLLYGGLVPSRKHDLMREVLDQRLQNFVKLKQQNPGLKTYIFATLMRSPRGTAGGTDAFYYEEFGPKFFRYGALKDKEESTGLTEKEKQELIQVQESIPRAYMDDWYGRRDKNLQNTSALCTMAREGTLNFFLLGRDDSWPYSQSRRDLRRLMAEQPKMPVQSFSTFCGADQLAMIMMNRAVNDCLIRVPFVTAIYPEGPGPKTVPLYQDGPAGDNIRLQIMATGSYPSSRTENADLVLAVYTAPNGITLEASDDKNQYGTTPTGEKFLQRVESLIQQGKKVAVASISYGNGADNGLLQQMADKKMFSRIASFSGWNTATNSSGFALGQGLLADRMPADKHWRLIATRLLDDWAYQANVRKNVTYQAHWTKGTSPVWLGDLRTDLENETTRLLREFAIAHLGDYPMGEFRAEHPWNRMFEVKIRWQ